MNTTMLLLMMMMMGGGRGGNTMLPLLMMMIMGGFGNTSTSAQPVADDGTLGTVLTPMNMMLGMSRIGTLPQMLLGGVGAVLAGKLLGGNTQRRSYRRYQTRVVYARPRYRNYRRY